PAPPPPTGPGQDAPESPVIYTLQAGDSDYEAMRRTPGPISLPVQRGAGYWIYLAGPTQISVPEGVRDPVEAPLPPGQYIMIGNRASVPEVVRGADAVYAYDPAADEYSGTTELQPGQGAFAYSGGGGVATITPSAP
ncbi:MAG TPA: hypothetical protein VK821_02340, partial [Dehalococcoidia bacterium]|nr:hypothetical protein [Dehalococcoidia bacterium]